MKLFQKDEYGNTSFVSVDETRGKRKSGNSVVHIAFSIILILALLKEGTGALIITLVVWVMFSMALYAIDDDL